MHGSLLHITEQFNGQFIAAPELLREKLTNIKAFVFDWDGVFNDGMKDENGSSPFSEVDSMGTNLLRLNYYLRTGELPVTAVITGEKNKAAFTLASREHFDAVYYGIRHKATALAHVCLTHQITPEEVAFVFDDVLDFSVAAACGLRIMVKRSCTPLLSAFAIQQGLADYLTAADGSGHAVREFSELMIGISGHYEETITHRMHYTEKYQQYLQKRNTTPTSFYSRTETDTITPNHPL
jgi:3-deoxy-D-manno-octulosonate 8-phosphate phosphatase (KDO 8-P phosphatase)